MDTVDLAAKVQVLNISNTKGQTKTTAFDFGHDVVWDAVSILFAPGHAGLTGVRITYQGNAILPWNQAAGQIQGDNERLRYDVGLYCTGKLSVVTINGDTYTHAWQLTFFYHEYQPSSPSSPITVPLVAVGG